ncbi:MFS transporter [Mycobacterium sp. JS623]|uniref:MFS transporter n=1 Tax=Mycobacterium sp. JS623 TaxID=212767 RepID=UPI00059CD8FB|nr:MFS transporter [Mycobacterium sp. JS623]
MLALLRHPGPLRRLTLTALQSSIGNEIGLIAVLLIASRTGEGAWPVTAVLCADLLPMIVLAPLAGVIIDRTAPKPLLVGCDLIRVAAFVGIAIATTFPLILGLALLIGIATAVHRPANKTALADLAGPNATVAMAALATSWSAALTVGPALAAGLLAITGVDALLLIDAVTFAVSALVIAGLPLRRRGHGEAGPDEEQHAGWRLLPRGLPAGLGAVLTIGFVSGLALAGINVAEPLLVTNELDAGDASFAVLIFLFGVGATFGGAACAERSGWRTLLAALALAATGTAVAVVADSVPAAAVAFVMTGVGVGAFISVELQMTTSLTPSALRGRVFGIKDSLDSLAIGAGLVLGGATAALSGPRAVFAAASVMTAACVLGGVAASRRSRRMSLSRSIAS